MPVGQSTPRSIYYLDLLTTQYMPYLVSDIARDLCAGKNEIWDDLSTCGLGWGFQSWYDNGLQHTNMDLNSDGLIISLAGFEPSLDYMKRLFWGALDLFRYHSGFYMIDPQVLRAAVRSPYSAWQLWPDYRTNLLNASTYWLNPGFVGMSTGWPYWSALAVEMTPENIGDAVHAPFDISIPKQSKGYNGQLGVAKQDTLKLSVDETKISNFLADQNMDYYADLSISNCKGYFDEHALYKMIADSITWTAHLNNPAIAAKVYGFRNWLLNYLFNNEIIGSSAEGLQKELGAIWASMYTEDCVHTLDFTGLWKNSYITNIEQHNWPSDFQLGAQYVTNISSWLTTPFSDYPTNTYTQFTPQKMGFNLDWVGDSFPKFLHNIHGSSRNSSAPGYSDHFFICEKPYNSKKQYLLEANDHQEKASYYDITPTYNYYLDSWESKLSTLAESWPGNDFELCMPNYYNCFISADKSSGEATYSWSLQRRHSSLNGKVQPPSLSEIPLADLNIEFFSSYLTNWTQQFLDNLPELAGTWSKGTFYASAHATRNMVLSQTAAKDHVSTEKYKSLFPFYIEVEIKPPSGKPSDFAGFLENCGFMPFFAMHSRQKLVTDADTAKLIPPSSLMLPGVGPSPVPELIAYPFTKYQNGEVLRQETDDFWINMYNVDTFIEKIMTNDGDLFSNMLADVNSWDDFKNYLYTTPDADDLGSELLKEGVSPVHMAWTHMKDLISNFTELNSRSYGDIISGAPAHDETIFYEVKKSKLIGTSSYDMQTFILSNAELNSTKENVANTLKLIDTQVLPGVKYKYEIEAYKYVLGSKYYYHIEQENISVKANIEYEEISLPPSGQTHLVPVPYPSAEVTIETVTNPSHKLVRLSSEPSSVSVQDSPPITPQVDIVPYRAKDNKLYIALNTSADDYYDWPQGITREEQNVLYDDAQYEDPDAALTHSMTQISHALSLMAEDTSDDTESVSTLFPLGPGKVRFKSDGDVYAFEIYRISEEDMPLGPRNYFDFGNPDLARKTTLIREIQTSFIDKVKPNINYYYIFRSLDIDKTHIDHRGWSNPTGVYRVKLVKNRENVYLDLELQSKEFFKTQQRIRDHIPTKSFKKYLMIRPTLEQSILNPNKSQGGVDYYGSGVFNSVKNYFLGSTADAVESVQPAIVSKPLGIKNSSVFGGAKTNIDNPQDGGKFRVRIKSKRTGKKVDIILGAKNPVVVDNTQTIANSNKTKAEAEAESGTSTGVDPVADGDPGEPTCTLDEQGIEICEWPEE